MQKVITLLEKHVQWIVIGLGLLFFGWMVYGYVLSPPVSATVDGKELTPGEIDPHILANDAHKLEELMNIKKDIDMTVTPFAEQFTTAMAWGNQPILTLDGEKFVQLLKFRNEPVPPVPGPGPIVGPGPQPPQPAPGVVVTALPKLPAAQLLESRVGRSTVLPQVLAGQAPPAPQPGVPVIGGVDKAWVTQKFKIAMTDVDAAFVAAKIPPQFMPTYFVQVELIRQEMDSAGNWDPKSETVIPPLANAQIKELPKPGDKIAEGDFLNWAIANTQLIIAPPFFAIAGGDPWIPPGVEAAAAAAQPFDPATTTKRMEQMTPEEKDLFIKYKQEEAKRKKEEQKNRTRTQPKPTPGRGGGPADVPGAAYAPRDEHYQAAPPARPPTPARPAAAPPVRRGPVNQDLPPEMRGANTDGVGTIGDSSYPGAIALPQPGIAFPNGEFVPATWIGKDAEGWAHDDTVVAGHTYRYKVRYKLKNPIFQTINVAKPQDLANQIAVVSTDSEWGQPVAVPNVVNFFVYNNPMQGTTRVKFDVFRWENGVQKKDTFTVEPGDAIGTKKNGVDFSTGCTVVDVRFNPRANSTEVIVMDGEGKTTLRSFLKDQNDPMYAQLKAQAAAAAPAPTGPAGAVGAVTR